MDRLILFARYPIPGTVLPDLAQDIGEQAAADQHREFLDKLIQEHSGQGYDFLLAAPSEEQRTLFDATFPLESVLQEGHDLRERTHNAFKRHLRHADKVIIIGPHVPGLSTQDVKRAFTSLDDVDVVLGPSHDGGYYLVGQKEPHDLFSGVPLEGGAQLRMTIGRALQAGKSFTLLKRRARIRTQEDLQEYFGA